MIVLFINTKTTKQNLPQNKYHNGLAIIEQTSKLS